MDKHRDNVAELRQQAEALAGRKGAPSPEQVDAMSLEEMRLMLHELHVHQIELEMQNEELRRVQVELGAAQARYFDLYDLAPVGYLTLSERGLILQANLTAATLLGVLRGALVQQLLTPFILREDQDIYYLFRKQLFASGEAQLCELRMVKQDGTQFWANLQVTLSQDAKGSSELRVVLSDSSDRKQAEERIQYMAHFDALTGLPNRANLYDRAHYALSLAQRGQVRLALMFLDLDNFKDINDTLGHSVGDALLVELARRLRLVMREEDTVSRLGGDEFILLLPGVDALGAAHVAQKVLEVISDPCRVEQYDLNVTGSIGIALYPTDGADMESLFKCADAAMYRAKQEGRNGYRFFTAEMQARSARHLQLANALRKALERGQLQVHYQPQICLQDGHLVGAEALLRWTHPELGPVSPAEFIPVAEDSGLILSIGEWVLRQAVRQAKEWVEKGLAPLVMAVNLSAVQFRHPDLPMLVTRILEDEGLPPEYLELELTEGVAMHNPQGAIAVMNNLHERGVRMSIDDFGTGYSSLSLLKKFKVYKLKIDQSFVRDISTDQDDRSIVSAIIHMAKSLGLKTIAEGVETAGQQAFLREQGCDEMQGYFYSKPLPADQFEAIVRSKALTAG